MLAALVLAIPGGAGAAADDGGTGPGVHGGTNPNSWRTEPIVPPLTGAVVRHVRAIVKEGQAKGQQRDIVAKIGDSITASDAYLAPLACTEPEWGGWARLKSTVRYFGEKTVPGDSEVACGRINSFSRASTAAVRGWTSEDALLARTPPPSGCGPQAAVACELEILHPSVALIMFGTNDVDRTVEANFRRHLAHIAGIVERLGVIPVISTIPPRLGRRALALKTDRFNSMIVAVAKNRRLPLWNYWRQMSSPGVPRHGIGPDGVHPSICATCSAVNFTPAGLHQGYALRNLGALRTLDRLRHRVLDRKKS